jgi:putative transposase
LNDPEIRENMPIMKEINREAGIWQRRYWEHTVRDEQDLNRHLDYIHYNPVKHGLVETVAAWPWSSFHRYMRDGYYPEDWGGGNVFGMDDLVVRE